ncbi:TetR/AcrR family transcriptional regulator [Bradyrhizobium sp. BR 10289]|uniref:TetR/AcrR family transcriptional regulator n=1 Tax=Bradyrhizobium sp. BR 10289 TaxID=2749993 RepID=UPI001C645AD1|nr:TetR/AcrR family transcriptional regulator [Bradyrhizobium sp. BR 10289]MBW7974774.1 TetR/AcrR family transcriptional regulator [Bradyrhizobium sp. BR 10289]
MQKAARMSQPARPPGRPREFDMETALDRALRVFRERGYHATSIGDLTAAMRLATGSVYKAFADKHAVFMAAFERYTALRQEQTRNAAARGENGRERLRQVLLSYVEHSQGIEGRRGCLVVGSAVELSAVDPVVAARVSAQLKTNESFIAGLIREGQADGSIPGHVEVDATARLMICITQGLRVVGKARLPLDGDRLVAIAMKLLA